MSRGGQQHDRDTPQLESTVNEIWIRMTSSYVATAAALYCITSHIFFYKLWLHMQSDTAHKVNVPHQTQWFSNISKLLFLWYKTEVSLMINFYPREQKILHMHGINLKMSVHRISVKGCCCNDTGIPIIKIRQSHDSFIFIMVKPILTKMVLLYQHHGGL